MELNIRIAGEAGQGIQTTGELLVDAFASMGLWVFATQSYMSRIRGGLNWYDVRVADYRITSSREDADILVALTEEALATLRPEVVEGGLILFDGDEAEDAVAINFTKIARDEGGSEVMANSVAGGAIFAMLGYDLAPLEALLEATFHKKGEQVVEANRTLVRRGAELTGEQAASVAAPQPADAPRQALDGTEATGLSAAVSGVKFVASYPMTPSTGVFTFLAQHADEYRIVVEQAEDEVAAINFVCGATYAGVPALTTTSGGGLALMSEGLSLAGMLELPAVIMLGMRPAPATGLPTRTAQGDLLFALRTGHGEFPRALFAPGHPQQAYELMRRTLETAHRFQTPCIFMTDQYLQDLKLNAEPLDATYHPIDRSIVEAGEGYRRYEITDSGVSSRAIPGGEAFVVVDSDEHDEEGHITEDLEVAQAMMDKRRRKFDGMVAEALPPELYRDEDHALTLLICWGSTWLPCREAVDLLRMRGHSVAMLHFAQLWPLNREAVRERLGTRERVICVEGNAWGQLASVLREQGIIGEVELLTRYDGLPFTAMEIAARVEG